VGRGRTGRGVAVEKTLCLSRLEPHLAAQLLAGCDQLDPTGTTSAADLRHMTEAGRCFAASSGTSQAVYILKVLNGVAWVDACKGDGPLDWTGTLLPVIEAQAAGCTAVAFQTQRRGLVRRAQRQGYEVAGYILKKALP
jgi:hypothetical protein